MTDPFTFWCCFYCDGELIVTAIYKKETCIKCKCGATGFIHEGKLYLNEREMISAENLVENLK